MFKSLRWQLLYAFVISLVLAQAAAAQTSQPTSPTCPGFISCYQATVIAWQTATPDRTATAVALTEIAATPYATFQPINFPPIDLSPIPSPTPLPTSTPMGMATVELPTDPLYNAMATAEGKINALPDDPRYSDGSSGQAAGGAIVPNENGSQIFGYFKWLSSSAPAQVLGPFAPMGVHFRAAIILFVFLAVLFLSALLIIALIKIVLKIVGLMASAA